MGRSGLQTDQWVRIAPWRDLPERFGDAINIHKRFSRWAEVGVWERVFAFLAADADIEYAMIDSTIVRAQQHSAGAKKKLTKTRLSDDPAADYLPKFMLLLMLWANPLRSS